MDKTKIEWTDATWNPIRGCSVVSEGCRNCYAMRVAARFSGPGQVYEGLAYRNSSGAHWTGNVRLVEEHLLDPVRWQRPRRIFVNSMSDLFYESLSDQQITDVFGVMALAHWHTFQVLTKRPERMRDYLTAGDHGIIEQFTAIQQGGGIGPRQMFKALDLKRRDKVSWQWPLPNVWLGVSVENQKTADERIPLLSQTPAAVRWLSCEPLLGPIDLTKFLTEPIPQAFQTLSEYYRVDGDGSFDASGSQVRKTRKVKPQLDWVVVGGESGHNARPMHPDWARNLCNQCVAAGVKFFFKQNGEYLPQRKCSLCSCVKGEKCSLEGGGWLIDDKTQMVRVGKKVAGRLLDGRTWDEYPTHSR